MLNRLLQKLLGRDGAEETPAVETIEDEKTEAGAVEHLGGFDPNELIEDDRPPAGD